MKTQTIVFINLIRYDKADTVNVPIFIALRISISKFHSAFAIFYKKSRYTINFILDKSI